MSTLYDCGPWPFSLASQRVCGHGYGDGCSYSFLWCFEGGLLIGCWQGTVASGGVAVAGDVGDTPLAVACVIVSPCHARY
jgi:hypothetical protein